MRPLIDELEAGRRNGREHGLFVLIGRRTFSSAVLNAIDLKQKAGAVLVGEPAGGEPNHYGEARSFELPYSGLSVQYSTKYFDTYRDGGETLVPDIAAPPRFEELAAGRDPAIEAVMRAVKTVAGVR
jgi:C-terminal processing protease CtpA/Prc